MRLSPTETNVGFWHIAKFDRTAKLGRNRGKADMAEPTVGSTRSRLTHKRHRQAKCYSAPRSRGRFSLLLTIRPPTIDELSGLSDLCFRSKAVWGYGEEFMKACRGELSFEPRDLELTPIAVAERDGKPIGVAQPKNRR